jgi:hypothetical protein
MAQTTNDPVAELTAAKQKRDELLTALPGMRNAAEAAAVKRRDASDSLERFEQDVLIGRVTDEKLKAVRDRHEAAVIEDRKAAATLRQAEEGIARLDEVISRLIPEAHRQRIDFYRNRQSELARQLHDGLTALRAINDALHEHYRAAEQEFPQTVIRGGGTRGYPVAAGITDLSWPELRENPHAQNGGRFGSWRKKVHAFLYPLPEIPELPPQRQSHLPVRDPRGSGLDIISATVQRLNGGY